MMHGIEAPRGGRPRFGLRMNAISARWGRRRTVPIRATTLAPGARDEDRACAGVRS